MRILLPSKAKLDKIEKKIGGSAKWAKNCHAASLAIVRSGLLPEGARVARGFRAGIQSQHSWACTGDPYDPDTVILDATLWSYVGGNPCIVVCKASNKAYRPHGAGSIWEYGRPTPRVGDEIKLKGLSSKALRFIHEASDGRGLDKAGWMTLANSPVQGWPAKEIFTAMSKDERLAHLIPIDILGMVTDENPGKLYW